MKHAAILLLTLALFACKSDDEVFFQVKTDIVNIDELGGTCNIELSTNQIYAIKLNSDWIDAQPAQNCITLQVSEMPVGINARESNLTITSQEGISHMVTVKQHRCIVITNDMHDLFLGHSVFLNLQLTDVAEEAVNWKSTDQNVAQVDATGKIIPLNVGECDVQAYSGPHITNFALKVHNIENEVSLQCTEHGISSQGDVITEQSLGMGVINWSVVPIHVTAYYFFSPSSKAKFNEWQGDLLIKAGSEKTLSTIKYHSAEVYHFSMTYEFDGVEHTIIAEPNY